MKSKSEKFELTTEHAACSYGMPVLVVEGQVYGPGDRLAGYDFQTAHDVIFLHTLLRKGSLSPDWILLQKKFHVALEA